MPALIHLPRQIFKCVHFFNELLIRTRLKQVLLLEFYEFRLHEENPDDKIANFK